MIISFEHRFAFVKVQKTAGTSIEVLLSQVAGPDAIVTPVNPPEPGHIARNFESTDAPTRTGRAIRRRAKDEHGEPAFYNHMSALLARERVGPERWDALYRFCFERNPWDKAVSMYFWRTRKLAVAPAFEAWATVPGNLVSERYLYTIDGALAVDFVGRYERLTEDLARVLGHVGVDTSISLPRAKSEHRPPEARTPIGDAADATIRETFAWEIEHLGYERPEGVPWA